MKRLTFLSLICIGALFVSCDDDIIISGENSDLLKTNVTLNLSATINYAAGSPSDFDDEPVLNDRTWWLILSNSKDTMRTLVGSDFDGSIELTDVPFGQYSVVLTNYATETGNPTENLGTDVYANTPGVVDLKYYGRIDNFTVSQNSTNPTADVNATPVNAILQVVYKTTLLNPTAYIADQDNFELENQEYYIAPPGVTKEITFSGTTTEGELQTESKSVTFESGLLQTVSFGSI